MDFAFENSFHDSMEGFYTPAEAAKPSAPRLLIFNHALAGRLGIDVAGATDDQLARVFSGEETPEGANPLALAYAGHQFGHFSPQLGDGRAPSGATISPSSSARPSPSCGEKWPN